MSRSSLEANNTGLDLIRRVMNAHLALEYAKSSVNSASCEVSNAENDLCKWLVPKGAKLGDVFCVPVDSTFLQVRMIERKAYSVEGPDHAPETKTIQELIPVVEWRDGVRPMERV